ncbi:hypothetical protein SLEP1_g40115 [Rubroshorea leprosula]|uniref:CobQ/CobB/MinD/ParA nucleotide binding domain-containing protein n=1 Tax=Rubroshorea leprosula TaxID=152421 RepID=A0AAV5L2T9_9ROSI|nr:hypothetical protein SLEP1_g40115 [Rubroshorea leprosula]
MAVNPSASDSLPTSATGSVPVIASGSVPAMISGSDSVAVSGSVPLLGILPRWGWIPLPEVFNCDCNSTLQMLNPCRCVLHFKPLNPTKTLKSHPKPRRSVAIASALQWNRKPQLAGETPCVVVITSGKGGVGKTITTANVGLSLARLGFSVVAIDADVRLRNLDLLLGLESRVNYTVVEVLNGDCRLDQALVPDKRWSNFELFCISKPRSKLPIGFGGKALVWLVDALKSREEGSPDFIL